MGCRKRTTHECWTIHSPAFCCLPHCAKTLHEGFYRTTFSRRKIRAQIAGEGDESNPTEVSRSRTNCKNRIVLVQKKIDVGYKVIFFYSFSISAFFSNFSR